MAEEDDAMILKFKLTEASSASSKLEVVLLLFFQPSSQLSTLSLLRAIEWVIYLWRRRRIIRRRSCRWV